MAITVDDSVVEAPVDVPVEPVADGTKAPIGLITTDFSREDLNNMRDKVNELIARS